MTGQAFLDVRRGNAPLILSIPHGGTQIPQELERRLASSWLARKDTDWRVPQLYAFANDLDVTIVSTAISRTVIDVNRDPSGASLYPGQPTTDLCPVTTFDGEDLYRGGEKPGAAEIAERRIAYFDPYHLAIADEIARLRLRHDRVVLYDAHSIRSRIPRLFAGSLPHFNLGTDNGRSCAAGLAAAIELPCWNSGLTWVTNGRFRGGWTTRHYGNPAAGIHAVQMELAMRLYLDEPEEPLGPENWPVEFHSGRAAKARECLGAVIAACVEFASESESPAPNTSRSR